jgi:hypothetical protein
LEEQLAGEIEVEVVEAIWLKRLITTLVVS